VGVDLHAKQQSLATLDTESGELKEKIIRHEGKVEKVLFTKIAEILGIETIHQNKDRRLYGFLLRSVFEHFRVIEFFNSHVCFRQSGSRRSGIWPVANQNSRYDPCTIQSGA
jgi:hypothetical protein